MATRQQAQGYSFELKGLKELIKLLDELPTVAMQKTVVRNALTKSCGPIVEAAKASVPVVTGNLRDSIHVSRQLKPSQRTSGYYDRSTVTVYVGSDAPHAHLVEFGTVERVLDKPRVVTLPNGSTVKITTTGQMSPRPFLRQAWDSMKRKALEMFADQMREQIYKSARRLAKRAEKGTLTKSQIRGLSK